MPEWLWLGLGLGFGIALGPLSKKATMAARLRRMLGCAAPIRVAPWPDLPPELLGLVLLRMPSRADRVRVCAVCRSWRSGARLQPPTPLLPWFALREGNFLSLPDGAVHRMPVPDCGDVRYRVSTGSMLFLVDHDGRCSLMSPSSGKTIPLQINPDHLELRSHVDIRKVVVSDDLHTVAVLTTSKTNSKNVTVYALGPQGATAMEWAPPVNSLALDIALFHGKLYVLTREHSGLLPELHVLEPRNTGIRSVQCIQRTHRDDDNVKRFFFYLVASGNRLLMVGRIVYPHPIDSATPSQCFKVFQAADLSSGHGWWSKANTLMGHALFVSQGCSRSLAVGGQSVSGVAQQDCIYFMSERSVISNIEEDFLNSCVYNIRDQTVGRLPLETFAPSGPSWGIWFPTWLFPAEV
ncbi:hypothetical protein VPH35_038191 [Triticum aestivum]